jgi:transcriptional regulator with XRE-family HTH domain
MMIDMTLSEYLHTADLTHSAFAEKLGVSQVTVHRWVNGKRFPDRDTILRIENVTGRMVRPADWFREETAA